MKFTTRQRLLASTLLIGAATLATPAWAQTGTDDSAESPTSPVPDADAGQSDPGAPPAATNTGDEIIVTGSRVPRRDLSSTSPLTVVNDEEFALTGQATVENVINSLPQVIPGTTSFSNNPGGGVATLNLRGLGTQRNLVLVNGRRYMFFDATQITDLNTIPSFLIDSVDVVTGGASAVYGSDALAGVTNFHLRNDLNGMIAGGTYSITEEGDGHRYDMYAAIGTDFGDGRGNVTIYGEYYNRGEIFQDARSFSAFAFNDGPSGSGILVPGGSSSVPQGRIQVTGGTEVAVGPGANCDPDEGPLVGCFPIGDGTNYAGSGAFFAVPGDSVPYVGGAQAYNYAPSNYLMVPGKRWTIGGYGEYDVVDGHTVYGEVAFVNNRVDNELAATPIGQAVVMDLTTVCAQVSADDCTQLTTVAANQQAAIAAGSTAFPDLDPTQVALNVNYRFTQISDRISFDDRNAYRMLAGVRGPITDTINYDIYYSYARTKNAQVQLGNVSRSAFITNVEDGTCNVFGANQLSAECIENVSIDAQNQEESILQVAQASISGEVPFTFPWATDAVGFAVGTEWRSMEASFRPDTALASGDVVGFNAGDPTNGQYDAKELFGEIRLPIVQDNFIKKLELSAAYRFSDYSLDAVGGVHTYALGAELAPVSDITFRAQYQRAIRAPNVGELFGGAAVGFPGADDPCSNRTPVAERTAELRAACIANGVPSAAVFTAAIQNDDQIEGAFGGNPNLSEETGDTYTIGAVIRPRWVPRLNIAIDWYSIKVADAIAVAGGSVQGVLDACLLDGAAAFCSLINRDPASGELSGNEFIVTANNQNLAQLNAEGIDWQLDYSHPMNFGLLGPSSKLSFNVIGNYTYRSSFIPYEGADEIECAGKFAGNCGEPTPKWKWTSRLSWMDGPLTTSVRWRHLSKVEDENGGNAVLEMDSYDLFDLAFAFDVTDNATLSFGINNLFDKKPPIVGANAEQANTYPSTYDVLGRDFFVSAAFRL
jgi:outer membrane receptor protein involved in Fe transport